MAVENPACERHRLRRCASFCSWTEGGSSYMEPSCLRSSFFLPQIFASIYVNGLLGMLRVLISSTILLPGFNLFLPESWMFFVKRQLDHLFWVCPSWGFMKRGRETAKGSSLEANCVSAGERGGGTLHFRTLFTWRMAKVESIVRNSKSNLVVLFGLIWLNNFGTRHFHLLGDHFIFRLW